MHFFYYFFVLLWFFLYEINIGKGDLNSDIVKQEKKTHTSLSYIRKKRYVVFPEGSTFSVAVSLNEDAVIYPAPSSNIASIFTTGLAWSLSFDLPNETTHEKNGRSEFPSAIRRQKRALFVKVEKLINSAGFEGKNCILKTICETSSKLLPKQGILEEILRLIFTFPEDKVRDEGKAITMYTKAHRDGELNENCDVLYPCPLSLLEFGLGFGKYLLV